MAQGKGYWYNPSINQAVEVSRHEIDIKKPSIQNTLKLRNDAKNEIDQLSIKPDNEDMIKMLAVRVGQIRVRDWQKFTSIQLFAKGNKLKDYLFSLAELIEHAKEKDKEFQSWDKPTQGLARLLATSWQLKIDNLATKATQSMSPNQFLKNYMDEGFMEEKNMKEKSNRVRDIPFSEELIRQVEARLSQHEEYQEEQRESLFEDISFRKECSKWKILNENTNNSNANLGIYSAYLTSIFQEEFDLDEENNQESKKIIELINQDKWESDPQKFYDSMQSSKHQKMLSPYTVQELSQMELYKVPGYDIGFALKKYKGEDKSTQGKEIVSVHNNTGISGLGIPIMKKAIEYGGRYLDHFDGFLTKFYKKLGFEEYKRDKYDPEYDKGGEFAKKYGKQDIIYRVLRK